MKINIVAKNMDLTDAIRSYLEDRINSLGKLIQEGEGEAMVEAEVGKTSHHHQAGEVFRTELNLTVNGKFHRAESVKDDLYASIDEAKDEMMRVLRSNKKKGESLFRRGAAEIKRLLRRG